MKTKPFYFAVLLSFLFASPIFAGDLANNDPEAKTEKMTQEAFESSLNALQEKVNFLKEAKRDAQTAEEKSEIRQEIRDVKKEARQLKQQASGGLYIGTGALLVIILILILL